MGERVKYRLDTERIEGEGTTLIFTAVGDDGSMWAIDDGAWVVKQPAIPTGGERPEDTPTYDLGWVRAENAVRKLLGLDPIGTPNAGLGMAEVAEVVFDLRERWFVAMEPVSVALDIPPTEVTVERVLAAIEALKAKAGAASDAALQIANATATILALQNEIKRLDLLKSSTPGLDPEASYLVGGSNPTAYTRVDCLPISGTRLDLAILKVVGWYVGPNAGAQNKTIPVRMLECESFDGGPLWYVPHISVRGGGWRWTGADYGTPWEDGS